MPTVVLPDPPPAEFEQLLERRRRTGADRHDELWEGVLHMAPAPHSRHAELQIQVMDLLREPATTAQLKRVGDFNLGETDDYRVPDGGLLRLGPTQLYHPTAALVLEILSPSDETWDKLPFYATHQVDEVLFIDPDQRTVQWLTLGADSSYHRIQGSAIIDLTAPELATHIDWPA